MLSKVLIVAAALSACVMASPVPEPEATSPVDHVELQRRQWGGCGGIGGCGYGGWGGGFGGMGGWGGWCPFWGAGYGCYGAGTGYGCYHLGALNAAYNNVYARNTGAVNAVNVGAANGFGRVGAVNGGMAGIGI